MVTSDAFSLIFDDCLNGGHCRLARSVRRETPTNVANPGFGARIRNSTHAWRELLRYVMFFVSKLKARTVEITGITRGPHEDWMMQIARNLTNPDDDFLRDVHRRRPA